MLEGSDPVFNRTAFKHAVQHLKKCIEACSVCKTTNLGLLHLSCSYTSFLLAFMVLTGPLALHRLTVCCSCTDAIHTISPFHDACYGKGKEGGKKHTLAISQKIYVIHLVTFQLKPTPKLVPMVY